MANYNISYTTSMTNTVNYQYVGNYATNKMKPEPLRTLDKDKSAVLKIIKQKLEHGIAVYAKINEHSSPYMHLKNRDSSFNKDVFVRIQCFPRHMTIGTYFTVRFESHSLDLTLTLSYNDLVFEHFLDFKNDDLIDLLSPVE